MQLQGIFCSTFKSFCYANKEKIHNSLLRGEEKTCKNSKVKNSIDFIKTSWHSQHYLILVSESKEKFRKKQIESKGDLHLVQ